MTSLTEIESEIVVLGNSLEVFGVKAQKAQDGRRCSTFMSFSN